METKINSSTKPVLAVTVKSISVKICAVCAIICLLFLFAFFLRESAKHTNCLSNLKQISLALQNYAVVFAGYYPPANGAAGLEMLRKCGYLTDYITCPGIKTVRDKEGQPLTEENVDYVYIGGLNTRSDPKQPLMYDKANNHGYYGNVLFADGTVEGIYGNPWTQNIKK